MRKKLSLIVVALLVTATLCIFGIDGAAKSQPKSGEGKDFDQMIMNRSKEVWEAYKSRNVAAIKALSGEDYASFTQAGPSDLKQDIATIDKLNIESYSVDNAKVSKATKDVAILRYKCDLKGSFEGKTFGPVYATEVWVNRGGKWVIVSYSETPVS